MPKVLVILPNNPGDVLMATPALRALQAQGHEVHFLVDRECAGLVAHNPNIRKLHVFERRAFKEGLLRGGGGEGIESLRDFISQLSGERFDRVVNLFQGRVTAILSGLLDVADTRGEIVTGLGKARLSGDLCALLYAIPYARGYAPAHAGDLYCHLCGVTPDGRGPELFVSDPDQAFARETLSSAGLDGDNLWVIHPFSAHRKKEWPAAHYQMLIASLIRKGVPVAVTGSAHERSRAEALLAAPGLHRALNLCGRTTFLQSAGVIQAARGVVSGDTVAMHMAASLGRRAIAIFAPTSPVETGPGGEGHVVFTAGCHCLGHYSGSCAVNSACAAAITPEVVLAEIEGRPFSGAPGVSRLVSGFDPETRWADFRGDQTSAYRPVSRWFLKRFTKPGTAPPPELTWEEGAVLRRAVALLDEMASSLRRVPSAGPQGQGLSQWMQSHASLERRFNLLSGFGGFVSAFLRLKNNSTLSQDLPGLAREMTAHAEELRSKLSPIPAGVHTEALQYPRVSVILAGRPPAGLGVEDILDYPQVEMFLSGPGAPAVSETAMRVPGEYLFFLGEETVPSPGILFELVNAIHRDPQIEACGPKLLKADDTVACAGVVFSPEGLPTPVGDGRPRFDPEVVQRRFFKALPFAGLLVRADSFKKAGGFDAALPVETAALDFCLRLNPKGNGILYAPDAEAYSMPGFARRALRAPSEK